MEGLIFFDTLEVILIFGGGGYERDLCRTGLKVSSSRLMGRYNEKGQDVLEEY